MRLRLVNISSQKWRFHDLAYINKLVIATNNYFHIGDNYLLDIPILLVNEDDFKRKKSEDDQNSTEYLGYYTRASNNLFYDRPVIIICPERILESSSVNNNLFEFKKLFTKVLIHELCHAEMDYCVCKDDFDTFYMYMEESIANFLKLKILDYINTLNIDETIVHSIKFSKEFIQKQPSQYQLGYWLYVNDIDNSLFWTTAKGNLHKLDQIQKDNFIGYINNNVGVYDKIKITEIFSEIFKALC